MNLQRVSEVFQKVVTNKTIESTEEWNKFVKFLRAYKLIQPDDLNLIDMKTVIFPLSLNHFLKMMSNLFNPEAFQRFESSIEKFNIQVNDCKTMINFWNVETLTSEEIKCLLIAFDKIMVEIKDLKKDFDFLKTDFSEVREDTEQIKDVLGKGGAQDKTSFDYQIEENFSIEKEYFDIRVRDVHYRNQPIKLLKEDKNGVIRQIGFCVEKDFALEVIKIPRVFSSFSELETYLFTFDAHKELIFSKYIPKYYGFNTISDQDYNLYFMELVKGKSMKSLLGNAKYRLSPKSLVFKHWIKEIFFGLKHILERTTYTLEGPIKLKHIYVAEYGTKIMFKNLRFIHKRNNIQECHENTEIQLLKNYLEIVLDLLESDSLENLKETFQNMELDAFLVSLSLSDQDFRRFREAKDNRRVTFETLTTNIILNDEELIQSDVLHLVEEYEQIFGS